MRFLSVALITTLCCCKAASISSLDQATLQKIVESEIGANAIVEKNNPSTFALAYQAKDRSVEFIVIRLMDLKIVVKEKIQGSVTWDRKMNIKVTTTPGIVKINSKPEDNVRVIDLSNYVIQNK
jgi:hypothetical protein